MTLAPAALVKLHQHRFKLIKKQKCQQ